MSLDLSTARKLRLAIETIDKLVILAHKRLVLYDELRAMLRSRIADLQTDWHGNGKAGNRWDS